MRRTWLTIATLLFLLTLAKGVVWASIIPIAQQPDEPAHAAYGDDLARTWSFRPGSRTPSIAMEVTVDASQFHRMVFRPWSIGAMDDAALDARELRLRETADSGRDELGTYSATAEGYPPLYYAATALAIEATEDDRYDVSWMAQRIVSVVMSSITIVIQFAALTLVFGTVLRAGLAALTLTMMPMYSSVESAINPEVLLTLFGSTSLLLSLLVARRPYRARLHVLSGLVLAALMLTKPNGAVFLLPYLVASVQGFRSHGWRTRTFARAVGTAMLPFSVLYAAWRLVPARPSARAGSDPLELLPAPTWGVEELGTYVSFLAREGRYRLLDTYWGTFGWVDATMPSWSLAVGAASALFVVVVLIVRGLEEGLPWWAPTLASSVVAVVGMLLFVEYSIFTTTGGGMIQGRYFFPVVVSVIAFQCWAVDQAVRSRARLRAAAWIAIPVVVSAMHVVAIAHVVIPRYYL